MASATAAAAFSRQRLRQAREAAGLSQERLARRIDRSTFTVIDYERGRARPSLEVLPALALALGVAVDALFESRITDAI